MEDGSESRILGENVKGIGAHANLEWFLQFKARMKRDFQQIDIWMITHPIEVL